MLTQHPMSMSYPLAIELVGPSGCGKTTLLKALNQRCSNIMAGVSVHELIYVPILLRIIVSLLPTFLVHYRHCRWLSWKETRSMIYIEAWHKALKHQPSSVIANVMDHGPLFRLARLHEFGPEITSSPVYEKWWNQMLLQWMNALNLVIVLDAPDDVLIERVRGRNTWHVIKEKSLDQGYDFLARYRKIYQQILDEISANPALTLLYFDTTQNSVEQIVDKVLITVESKSKQLSLIE